MTLADPDRELVTDTLDREPTRPEAALFENLWSEHCAYRSSRPLLGAFESDGEQVVVGPGDDAAVVALPIELLLRRSYFYEPRCKPWTFRCVASASSYCFSR